MSSPTVPNDPYSAVFRLLASRLSTKETAVRHADPKDAPGVVPGQL